MRNSIIMAVMSGLLLVLVACQDDQTVTPKGQAPFYTSQYQGTYVTVSRNASEIVTENSAPCRISFNRSDWAYAEIPDSEESPWNECEVVGTFALVGDGLIMHRTDTNMTRWMCDLDAPHGRMELSYEGDSIILFGEEYNATLDQTYQQWLRLASR